FTHWHAPAPAPAGTQAQNGDSGGHEPPQSALPAAGSPPTTPHVTGGGGGIGQAYSWTLEGLEISKFPAKTFPLASTAIPVGAVTGPNVVRKVPMFVNAWTRIFAWSVTQTFPSGSTARSSSEAPLKLNCPSPLPPIPARHPEVQVWGAGNPSVTPHPKVRRKLPSFLNFWMRLFPFSATNTFPLPSTAMPSH